MTVSYMHGLSAGWFEQPALSQYLNRHSIKK